MPLSRIRIDDAEEHPQRRRLARSIRPENTENAAFRDGNVDPVHRHRAIEPLDEAARLDRQPTVRNCAGIAPFKRFA